MELSKLTTAKYIICLPIVDSNSHLTTKPSNFDIKCWCNSKNNDQHGLWVVRIFVYIGKFFNKRERVLWWWLAGTSLKDSWVWREALLVSKVCQLHWTLDKLLNLVPQWDWMGLNLFFGEEWRRRVLPRSPSHLLMISVAGGQEQGGQLCRRRIR